jgi:hypothetical protein
MSLEISLLDDEVVGFFTGDMSLISSSVTNIQIYNSDGIVVIDIHVRLLYSKDHRNFNVRFRDVVEYSFYHHKDYDFYNVERLKFFKNGSEFYISLDPDEDTSMKSESDNDFIVCRGLKAFSI